MATAVYGLGVSLESGDQFLADFGTVSLPGFSFNGDSNTGATRISADVVALAAGGINIMEFGESGGSTPLLGFFTTSAVAKPAGVAVSAAGVHAALVTLGLIAGP